MPLIFQMFGRTARGSRRTHGGLGIGLALVQKLVAMHGGTVAAHSDGRDRGSRFTVRLPLHRSPAAHGAAVPGADHAVAARVRVLVIDDNADAADSMAMLLRDLGAEVRVARDGTAALDAYERFHPRVVLLDIGMPGMDGYAVAQRLRSRAGGGEAGVEIVAVTGWGQEEDKARARAAGFDHHLVKPPQIEALRALLAAAARR
jgi:CheY-like chemotaxis protein